jgi:hypothetical protein
MQILCASSNCKQQSFPPFRLPTVECYKLMKLAKMITEPHLDLDGLHHLHSRLEPLLASLTVLIQSVEKWSKSTKAIEVGLGQVKEVSRGLAVVQQWLTEALRVHIHRAVFERKCRANIHNCCSPYHVV